MSDIHPIDSNSPTNPIPDNPDTLSTSPQKESQEFCIDKIAKIIKKDKPNSLERVQSNLSNHPESLDNQEESIEELNDKINTLDFDKQSQITKKKIIHGTLSNLNTINFEDTSPIIHFKNDTPTPSGIEECRLTIMKMLDESVSGKNYQLKSKNIVNSTKNKGNENKINAQNSNQVCSNSNVGTNNNVNTPDINLNLLIGGENTGNNTNTNTNTNKGSLYNNQNNFSFYLQKNVLMNYNNEDPTPVNDGCLAKPGQYINLYGNAMGGVKEGGDAFNDAEEDGKDGGEEEEGKVNRDIINSNSKVDSNIEKINNLNVGNKELGTDNNNLLSIGNNSNSNNNNKVNIKNINNNMYLNMNVNMNVVNQPIGYLNNSNKNKIGNKGGNAFNNNEDDNMGVGSMGMGMSSNKGNFINKRIFNTDMNDLNNINYQSNNSNKVRPELINNNFTNYYGNQIYRPNMNFSNYNNNVSLNTIRSNSFDNTSNSTNYYINNPQFSYNNPNQNINNTSNMNENINYLLNINNNMNPIFTSSSNNLSNLNTLNSINSISNLNSLNNLQNINPDSSNPSLFNYNPQFQYHFIQQTPQSPLQSNSIQPSNLNQNLFSMNVPSLQYSQESSYTLPFTPSKNQQLSTQAQQNYSLLQSKQKKAKPPIQIDFESLSIPELISNCQTILKDQYGCRYLQKKIEENPEIGLAIWNNIIPNIVEIVIDSFGNYLVQKLFDYMTEEMLNQFLVLIKADLYKICINSFGTRVIQKLIDYLKNEILVKNFLLILKPIVKNIILDINGSHILLKLIDMSNDNSQFNQINQSSQLITVTIYTEIDNNIVDISKHKHGCCILQKCIEKANQNEKNKIINLLLFHCRELIVDQCGNYIIQFISSMNNDYINSNITDQLCLDIQNYSKHKFSSNVIERCLDVGSKAVCHKIIKAILGNPNCILELLFDKFGNYVIQKALEKADKEDQEKMLNIIAPHLNELKSLPFGFKLYSKFIINYSYLSKIVLGKNAEGQINGNNQPNIMGNNKFNNLGENGFTGFNMNMNMNLGNMGLNSGFNELGQINMGMYNNDNFHN